MDIKTLEEELAKYIAQKEQAIANANAFSGAIQAINALIEKEKATTNPAP